MAGGIETIRRHRHSSSPAYRSRRATAPLASIGLCLDRLCQRTWLPREAWAGAPIGGRQDISKHFQLLGSIFKNHFAADDDHLHRGPMDIRYRIRKGLRSRTITSPSRPRTYASKDSCLPHLTRGVDREQVHRSRPSRGEVDLTVNQDEICGRRFPICRCERRLADTSKTDHRSE